MNPAHLHLFTNHVPVLGVPAVIVLLALGLVWKHDVLVRVGLGAAVVVTLLAIPAYLSGEPAEEIVEDLPNVSHEVIEAHEDMAKPAFVVTLLIGGVALIGLGAWRRRERLSRSAIYATLALSLVGAGLLARTAWLGGQIRHSEIRANPDAPAGAGVAESDDDDAHER